MSLFVTILVIFNRRLVIRQLTSRHCLTDGPVLPEIFISFERLLTNKTVAYDRGVDKQGDSTVTLERNASIGPSEGRIGNVLRLVGIKPAAVIGQFEDHPLK